MAIAIPQYAERYTAASKGAIGRTRPAGCTALLAKVPVFLRESATVMAMARQTGLIKQA